MVKETMASLRKLIKGTGIKVTKVKGCDNVVISGWGNKLYAQLDATGHPATEIIKARKKVHRILKKDKVI